MNAGVIIEGSVLANDDETLQVLNFKRGILSAIQFPVLDTNEYKSTVNVETVNFEQIYSIHFLLTFSAMCIVHVHIHDNCVIID